MSRFTIQTFVNHMNISLQIKAMSNCLFLFLLLSSTLNAQNFGEKGHPMNKSTDSREILKYWGTTPYGEINLYESAYKILSAEKNASYADLIKNSSFKDLLIQQNREILAGPMLGQIKSNGASVWLRTLEPAKVEVWIEKTGEGKIYGPVFTDEKTELSAVVKIDDLKPSTSYPYKIIVNGITLSPSVEQIIKTLPEDNQYEEVKIAFGSCPHRWGLGNHTLLEQIQERGNQAMLFLGDIAVQDRNDHLGMHRADYLLRDFLPAWQNFAAQTPVYASWDDHDYFDNDKAGIPEGYSEKGRNGVREVFKHSWVNHSYGDEANQEGIFTRDRIGPFDILMTDNRYFRTGEKGSFLGPQQMNWLKEQLLDCEGPFIVLSCGSMWSDFVSNGKDSWGVNDPEGRDELFSFIEENNISGVLLISGDRHGARGFTIPRKSDFGFYEFEAASLGARIGPPAIDPSWDTQLYGTDGQFAFGEFTYLHAEQDPAVVFRLVGEAGNIIYEKTIHKSELTP
ncbi:MAG: alkaline phosphatase family protein [Cytophagales bacterium]|uniref:alkaline phosphatase D family protein n=1 Tax=Cyclobacterium marinum TaxID=104 RepID=UPI0011F06D4B|nr:alkaline phosphatase D family protein [Cyclobacterium marinum]MBI0398236.1 alkaline phosphatase D family protein [Cyclobacterium marinum]MBR9776410.1 alkaline phosphatase family protein [Cytophagales bacterium]|tara:strand:+ start:6963 stop:8492 length:1530 start_codon:yes stop_codon:yes gene_type:complete